MFKEEWVLDAHSSLPLCCVLWMPEGDVKGVLQLTHGMTEHSCRYDALARTLTAAGWAVAGFDLPGHGRNPGSDGIATFGQDGWEAALEAMGRFSGYLRDRFPGAKLVLHGFSLGSFLLREYLQSRPEGVSGAVIIGTGCQPGWLLRIIMAVVNREVRKVGFDGYSSLVRQLSFGTYNQKFKPLRTEKDWLCSDEAQLDLFLADPRCRENFSAGLFLQMLSAMERTGKQASFTLWDPELPVLLISGDRDPVGDMGTGARKVLKMAQSAGLHTEFHLIPGARHDVLHEEASGAAETARTLILNWLEKR